MYFKGNLHTIYIQSVSFYVLNYQLITSKNQRFDVE